MRGDEELLEAGARRPLRAGLLLVVIVLLAAAVGGYIIGHYTGSGKAPAAVRAGSSTAQLSAVPAGLAITDTGNRCAVQHGSALQLGAQLANRSTRRFVISYVRVVLPLGGLRAQPVTASACGQLGAAAPAVGQQLDPGSRLWLAARFDVRVRCPQPLPVIFEVHLSGGGQVTAGFGDLGDVPYSGCH